ncbi:MAG: NADH-quinone oxidoreductase subunit H [Candidatus Methanomethyliaceae archaeon]|nr:NADH-quinone oxidoreductase subunit H [Candidatus Methanomethyliaceae archaeon]MDW7971323.1 complex I subunit 1 family protein [Nitrososphaerota archaeon]
MLGELINLLIFPGFLFLITISFIYEWIDRKFFARIQGRYGPLYTGPSGVLQPFADFLKLLSKEDITPAACERTIFSITPIVYTAIPLIMLSVIPLNGRAIISFEGDIIFLMFLSAMVTLSVFLAGWSSANNFSRVGSVRAALQMLSYEIPLGLSMIGPAIVVGSLSLSKIVEWQIEHSAWFLWLQPIGFAVMLISLIAELERIPFDIPEAETEIVAGWMTEYGGRKLALLRLGKNLELLMASMLISSIYLGGGVQIYFLPPLVVLLIKSVIILLIMSLIRGIFARFRIDQVTSGMWSYLLPLMIFQIMLIQFGVD